MIECVFDLITEMSQQFSRSFSLTFSNFELIWDGEMCHFSVMPFYDDANVYHFKMKMSFTNILTCTDFDFRSFMYGWFLI